MLISFTKGEFHIVERVLVAILKSVSNFVTSAGGGQNAPSMVHRDVVCTCSPRQQLLCCILILQPVAALLNKDVDSIARANAPGEPANCI